MGSATRYIQEHRWLWLTARLLLGLTYLFSSLTKAIDPYGTVLKVEEYLHAMELGQMGALATPLTVVLIGFEMLLGVALLLGAAPRVTSRVAVVVGAVFTLFTLWVAVENPVAECGCFGDVVVLTNAQTFGKNVLLLLLSIVTLCGAGGNRSRGRVIGAVGAMLLVVLFCLYGLVMLPVVDRFPFGEGVDIAAAIERELAESEGETFVVCRSVATGEQVRFSPDDSEWWDEEKWEFVRIESPEESIKVRARDFRITIDDYDFTDQVLAAPICRLICVESVEDLTESEKEKIRGIAGHCMRLGNKVVVVSASPLMNVSKEFLGLEIGNMDAVTLRALVRAPEGVVTLQRGRVVHKTTLRAAKVE